METIDKEQIKALEQTLLDAMKNNDLYSLDELLDDQLLFVIPTGQTVTKEMDLSNLKSGKLKIDAISSYEQEIHLIDDNAVVSTVIGLQGNYSGQTIDEKFKYIRVWKLRNKKWKVIGGAGVQMRE